MILPSSHEMVLLLGIISMICWGSWASTFKLTGPKWRFELYYFDFAFGIALTAVIVAITLGSMGDELSFADNLLIARKRYLAFALLAGAVFNLGNMLLMASVSIAGMSVAFPLSLGTALIIGTIEGYVHRKAGSAAFLFAGVALIIVAVVLAAMAYGRVAGIGKSGKKSGAMKGIIVGIVGGILLGGFYPIISLAKAPGTDFGLGPYAILFLFGIGVFFSTIIYNLYFINLPVHGEATEFGAYLKSSLGTHLLGMIGGLIWCVGAAANFIASAAPVGAQVGHLSSFVLAQGAAVVAALWGVLVWKELKDSGAFPLVGLMIASFIAGLALMGFAA